MNKYHLARVLDRVQKRRSPSIEAVAIPFAMFWAFLLALLPTDFQDYLGVRGAAWEALALGGVWLSGLLTIVLFLWWLFRIWKYPPKDPEQIIDDIIDEMNKDKERFSKLQSS